MPLLLITGGHLWGGRWTKILDLTFSVNRQLGNSDPIDILSAVQNVQKLPYLGFWETVNEILKRATDVVFRCQQRCAVQAVDETDIVRMKRNLAEEKVLD